MIALTLSKSNPVALTIFTVLCSHHCPANRFLILHTESKTSDLDLGSLLQNKRQVLRILIRVRKAIKEMGGGVNLTFLVWFWIGCVCVPCLAHEVTVTLKCSVEVGNGKAWERRDRRLHNKLGVGVVQASSSLLFTKLESRQETEPTQIKMVLRELNYKG